MRVIVLLAFLILGPLHGAQAQAAGIERVRWLSGCWQMSAADRTVEEHWMAPRGNTMLGMGRTVRGDSLVDHELVILRSEGAMLAYEAHPAGQSSATFLATIIENGKAVFENPTHDFPQRVGYQLRGTDSLVAWVEGTRQGRVRRIEFPYRRTSCPG